MHRRVTALIVAAVVAAPVAQASAAEQHSLRVGGTICVSCTSKAGGTWRVVFPGIKWVRTPSGAWVRRWRPARFVWVRSR